MEVTKNQTVTLTELQKFIANIGNLPSGRLHLHQHSISRAFMVEWFVEATTHMKFAKLHLKYHESLRTGLVKQKCNPLIRT